MSQTVKLHASDISCQHCAMAIKRALASVTGVSAVEVDVLTKMVTLTIADEQALDRARASLDDIGYPATLA